MSFGELIFPTLLGGAWIYPALLFWRKLNFLSYLRGMARSGRIIEAGKLLAVRTFFFAFLGVIAGYAGGTLEFGKNMVIYLYLLLGAVFLTSKLKPLPVPNITPLKLIGRENDSSLPLAVNFGLSIPSCVLPLLLAMLLDAVYLGDAFLGFVSLFVFSLALSLPTIFISGKNGRAMEMVRKAVDMAPVLAGAALIAFAVVRLTSPLG